MLTKHSGKLFTDKDVELLMSSAFARTVEALNL
jgi:hypothetical protein